jgi:hypothetical protein|tara:strand:- start:10771 stop:10911 length:141 start_codon:yes stop_codon:yes gene_type:complete
MTNISIKSTKHFLSEFDKPAHSTTKVLESTDLSSPSFYKRRLRTGL